MDTKIFVLTVGIGRYPELPGLTCPPNDAKDFAATLLGFVDQILRSPQTGTRRVAFDFWDQFDAAERLEDLRLFRPSVFKGLPDDGNSQLTIYKESKERPL